MKIKGLAIKILVGLIGILAIFLIYASLQPNTFHYEVKGTIEAPIEKVFPYLSDLKLGGQWSPFEKVDPNMKREFQGPVNEVGGKLIFKGNAEAGAGSIEILNIDPLKQVDLKLIMTEPMYAENNITYKIESTGNNTLMTWSMSGNVNFIGKVVNVLIDCEKMITDQFKKGISNLNELLKGDQ